jgi:hypothetical protein
MNITLELHMQFPIAAASAASSAAAAAPNWQCLIDSLYGDGCTIEPVTTATATVDVTTIAAGKQNTRQNICGKISGGLHVKLPPHSISGYILCYDEASHDLSVVMKGATSVDIQLGFNCMYVARRLWSPSQYIRLGVCTPIWTVTATWCQRVSYGIMQLYLNALDQRNRDRGSTAMHMVSDGGEYGTIDVRASVAKVITDKFLTFAVIRQQPQQSSPSTLISTIALPPSKTTVTLPPTLSTPAATTTSSSTESKDEANSITLLLTPPTLRYCTCGHCHSAPTALYHVST